MPSNGVREVQDAQDALGWGKGVGYRILKDPYMGQGYRLLRWSFMGRGGYRMIRESSIGRDGCRMLEAIQRGRRCRTFRKDNLPGQGCRLRVVS